MFYTKNSITDPEEKKHRQVLQCSTYFFQQEGPDLGINFNGQSFHYKNQVYNTPLDEK